MDVNARKEHGNSPAAWTTVAIMIIGFLISAAAVLAALPPLFWVGFAVSGVGLLVGWLMAAAGLGSMPNYGTQEPSPTRLEGPTLPPSTDSDGV